MLPVHFCLTICTVNAQVGPYDMIAKRLSARQLILQYGAKSQVEFVCIICIYVCMYICMYVSVTLKNAHMSHLGMQFYTMTRHYQRTRLYRGRWK